MRYKIVRSFAASIAAVAIAAGSAATIAASGKPQVTLISLLEEMVDRSALARWPAPAYSARQVSTYDRRQVTHEDPAGWFANQDYGYALRIEEVAGSKEWVILDHEGPGCITRIWNPNADAGTVRFYLDGSDQPAIEANFQELAGGRALTGPPLALLAVRGNDCYFPISFAQRCKITLSKEPFYYAVQYRAYEPETVVETYSEQVFQSAQDAIARAGEILTKSSPAAGEPWGAFSNTIASGGGTTLSLPQGPAAVTELKVWIRNANAIDIEQALRSLVLKISFDGEQTVWCPLGDFFGLGIAREPYSDWNRTVGSDGRLTCRWVMPYERAAQIELINLSETDIEVDLSASTGPWRWDERSLHFHTNWRRQFPISEHPLDWNYLNVEGTGVYAGDTLTTMNPQWSWWGEGDEKVYIDAFDKPALVGTGLEDYYGYAWGVPNYFMSPFLSASRVRYTPDEKDHIGHTTVSRIRSLDAIPFSHSLRFDMEISCIGKNEGMEWSVASFWYARPGAQSQPKPAPDEAASPIQYPKRLSRRHLRQPLTQAELDRLIPGKKRLPGAIECEEMMQITTQGVTARRQDAYMYIPQQQFSGGDFLYVDAKKAEDFVELKFPPGGGGPWKLTVYPTLGPDFGTVRFIVNGEDVAGTHDLSGKALVVGNPIELGTFDAPEELITLRVVAVGPGDSEVGDAGPFGLDCVIPALNSSSD